MDKLAFFLLCVTLAVAGFVAGKLASVVDVATAVQNARQAEQPNAPELIVLEDKKRGATCYKLDWSDELSCIPSQWLYNDTMNEGEGK